MPDEHLEHLKSCPNADWSTPPDESDITPAHEVLLLREQFKELQKTAETSTRSSDFQRHLSDIRTALGDLHKEFQGRSIDPDLLKLNALFDQVTQSCITRHSKYRD